MVIIEDPKINRDEIDKRTDGEYVGHPLAFFRCGNCNEIYISIDCCHVVFIDGNDLNKTDSIHGLDKPRCPHCKALWYKVGWDSWKTTDVTLEDFKDTKCICKSGQGV